MQSSSPITQFSIAKFSYACTSVDHSGPLAWTHVNTNGDLQCIFEKVSGSTLTGPPRLLLRVIRNDGILEQMDILHFVRVFSNYSSPENGHRPAKQLFAVVVKSPCLAVKYPQGGSHVRRFQIKFSRTADYFNAIAHLSEISCPMTEGGTSQPRRQVPYSTWTSSTPMSNASVDGSRAMSSSQTTPIPFFAMPDYAPGSIATSNPPPSSCTSTSYQQSTYQRPPPVYNPPGLSPGIQTVSKPESSMLKPTRRTSNRPVPTPAYDEAQLDRMLPPKRDLPFLKPARKGPIRKDSSNKVAAKPGTTSAQSRIEAQTQSQMERYALLASDSQTESLIPTQTYQDSQVSPLSHGELEYSQIQQSPVSTPVPVSTQLMERGSPKNTNVAAVISLQSPLDRDCFIVEREQAPLQHLQRPRLSENDELSLYLSAPTAERTAFLQDWMCNLLQDDQFMTLCEDTEQVWMRFAFGKK